MPVSRNGNLRTHVVQVNEYGVVYRGRGVMWSGTVRLWELKGDTVVFKVGSGKVYRGRISPQGYVPVHFMVGKVVGIESIGDGDRLIEWEPLIEFDERGTAWDLLARFNKAEDR